MLGAACQAALIVSFWRKAAGLRAVHTHTHTRNLGKVHGRATAISGAAAADKVIGALSPRSRR